MQSLSLIQCYIPSSISLVLQDELSSLFNSESGPIAAAASVYYFIDYGNIV